jgi:hypothetical protein
VTEVRVRFSKPARLGQDAALALEDYARASSSFDASVIVDANHYVIAVDLDSGDDVVDFAVSQDIERFFDSLASDAADRLGWS